MRFQATETVHTSDTERVLDALEQSLRQLSDEVERVGRQITLRGLGPSPRVRNYRDVTVFDIAANNGHTVINADVTFQASALLGPAGQDAVVRGKLDSVFEQVRAQLGLSNGRHPEAVEPVVPRVAEALFSRGEELSQFASLESAERGAGLVDDSREFVSSQFADETEPLPEVLKDVDGAVSAGEATASEPAVETVAEPVAEPVKKRKKVNETVKRRAEWALAPEVGRSAPEETPVQDEGGLPPASGTRRVVLEPPPMGAAASRVSSSRLQPVARPAQSASDSGVKRRAVVEQLRSSSQAPDFSSGETHKTKLPILVVGILAVIVAAGSVYLYWAGEFNLAFARRMISTTTDPQPVSPPPMTVTPVEPPVEQPDPRQRHEEQDPKAWLGQWADAMRGRDPVLQASFYADPVRNYLGDPNVNNDSLATGFRSAIQARDGIWTLKLEKVSVEKRSADDVIVRLTKHFMQMDDGLGQSTGQINDRYVRSRLELRRANGEWKIVSEQDATAPNAAVAH